ncbi:MAG: hypothetical protein M3R09_01295 [Actinomycetota bacterium]|jgi:hypothetical protein|nr:hypothetical protein [Actinomycetota bacterium]
MYRDDTCAVCGDPLPPDHFYCRRHAATVDDRLHEIGELLGRAVADLPRLATLLGQVAQETWDYLADGEVDAPQWPPVPPVELRAHADEVDVDVDTEPGRVRLSVTAGISPLLAALAAGLDTADVRRLARACSAAQGADATH